jgi:hypothetical protein
MDHISLLGYVASLLVAVSLSLSSIVWLRVINLAGCLSFFVYGLAIGAWPVAIANGYIALINAYHLDKLRKES